MYTGVILLCILLFSTFQQSPCFYAPSRMPLWLEMHVAETCTSRQQKGWTDILLFFGVLNPCTHVAMKENNMWEDRTPWPLDYSDMLTLHVHWIHISILLFSIFQQNIFFSVMCVFFCMPSKAYDDSSLTQSRLGGWGIFTIS
jgi:hypothetical protein